MPPSRSNTVGRKHGRSLQKIHKASVIWEDEPSGGPTKKQWEKISSLTEFTLQQPDANEEDEDNIEIVFKPRDVAIINYSPHDPENTPYPFSNCWVGRIVELKKWNLVTWAKIRWFYTPEDIKRIRAQGDTQDFDTTLYGAYERLSSDHYGFVQAQSFRELTRVHKFNEDDIQQAFIPPGEFYTRYYYVASKDSITPEPGESTCVSTCRIPFSPDRALINGDDTHDIMHFCARPACRRWYHASCLRVSGYMSVDGTSPDSEDIKFQLLMSSPDQDGTLGLHSFIQIDDMDKDQRLQSLLSKPNTHHIRAEILRIVNVPPVHPLLAMAQQAITRGGGPDRGVVGNIKAVIRARRMVYDAIICREGFPPDWGNDAAFAGFDLKRLGGDDEHRVQAESFKCPKCHGII